MTKKQLDETAARIGVVMCYARRTCHMSRNEVAELLRITHAELLEYERGTDKIPFDILNRIFVLSYKTIQLRRIESKYYQQRNMFRKMKQNMTSLHKSTNDG